MDRVLIVSNRLPYNISVDETTGGLVVKPSVGGLATGMKSVVAPDETDYSKIRWLSVVGRLKPGVPLAGAQAALQAIEKEAASLRCFCSP